MDFTNLIKALEDKRYKVSTFKTKEDAAKYLNKEIDNKTVAFGGSVTLTQMGLYESLGEHNKVYWHWKSEGNEAKISTMIKASTTDVYLLSANAITEAGEIVNLDSAGNRVASSMFGHQKVYYVISKNKIVKDTDAAIYRTRYVVAPQNAKRLNKKTPCAIDGKKCYDCKSPDRICNILCITIAKPTRAEVEILLVDEDLGL